MKLSELNEQCVRLTLKNGEVFEGVCLWYSAEYCEHEFGRHEACLDIADWLFYQSEIQKAERLADESAFRTPYGLIEETAVREGTDTIRDALYSDVACNVLRLLRCIRSRLPTMPDRDAVLQTLRELLSYHENGDPRVPALMREILEENRYAE